MRLKKQVWNADIKTIVLHETKLTICIIYGIIVHVAIRVTLNRIVSNIPAYK